jgi:DNA-binding NarL/FixJ family response regulator
MRLVLCDDNRILGEALASVFQVRGHQVLAVATRVAEGIAAVAAYRPDVCLLDLRFPEGSGLDAARVMRRCQPATKILVLSCLADLAALSEARSIGVAGFLRKDQKTDTIAGAIDTIGAGGMAFDPQLMRQASRRTVTQPSDDPLATLTPRETEVLHRIVEGQSTRQMAGEMNVATSTLRSYIKSILAKLGAHSRLQAAAIVSQVPQS